MIKKQPKKPKAPKPETSPKKDRRGTLKLNTLKATLQMVNHLVEVAISMSDTAVQELSWFDFLDDITEPELIQYLKERRLYVNEPVNANAEED